MIQEQAWDANSNVARFNGKLASALHMELDFIHNVASGLENTRKDLVERHLAQLNQILNLVPIGTLCPPAGVSFEFVNGVSNMVMNRRKESKENQMKGFVGCLNTFEYKTKT